MTDEAAERQGLDVIRASRTPQHHMRSRAHAVEDLERLVHHLRFGALGADLLGEGDVRQTVVEPAGVRAEVVAAFAQLGLDTPNSAANFSIACNTNGFSRSCARRYSASRC